MTAARAVAGPALVVVVQVALFLAYGRVDAHLHYWLHALAGATFGVGVLTATSVIRGYTPAGVWAAGAVGHLWSAVPDVLFLVAGVLHVRWMDMFIAHITVHFIPVPLVTLFVLFVGVLVAHAVASFGCRAVAAGLLAVLSLGAVAALVAADGPPASLQELRDAPQLVMTCPLRLPAGEGTT